MEKKINIVGILTNGVQIGLKNLASLIGAVILYVLTCWIPYINIGTTIAMASLPMLMAKGEIFSPTAIFDKKYRQFMGEYFILRGLKSMAIFMAFCFFVFPGIVLYITWSLAICFLLDKQMNPTEALTASNKATNGYKWTIFLSMLALGLVVGIAGSIFSLIPILGIILIIVLLLLIFPVILGMQAYIYRELSK